MRRLGFILGLLLLVAGAAAVLRDLWLWLDGSEGFRLHALGNLWAAFDAGSLASIEPSLPAWLWSSIVGPLLDAPAALVLGVPALLLLWLCRPRRVRRFY